MRILRYLNYIFWHKYYVFKAGASRGAPFWQLLIHDLSKFRPDEFFPYLNHFYPHTPDKSKGKDSPTFQPFMEAFGRHWTRNPHHWEYWSKGPGARHVGTDGLGGKIFEPSPMPNNYRREMLADWDGTGMSKTGKNDTLAFYLANKERMVLHPETRLFVEIELLLTPDPNKHE